MSTPIAAGSSLRTTPAGVSAHGWGWRHAGRAAWAVRGLDLDIEPGERVLLLGPSGAGKSTLLGAVAGLLRQQDSGEEEGRLLVDGAAPEPRHGRIGYVQQDPEAQLVMARAGDDVAFGLENLGMPAGEIWARVDAALDAVGFPFGRERSTAALSGGQKQRLALAGILALGPGLLLLDEPTANLDPDGARLVRDAVADVLATTGATLIVVEHRVEQWLDLVDRVVVLEPAGGLRTQGRPEHIFAAERQPLADAGIWVPGWELPQRQELPRPAGEVVLAARAVEFRWPGAPTPAVDDAALDLATGEAVAIVGANGSGKSTLAGILSGLLAPQRGAATLRGSARPLHRWRARDLARRVGTVFQEPEHQFLTRTVRDELLLGPQRTGAGPGAAARVDALLDALRLTRLAAANPFTLSGGEKRRLSVGTALACEPDVLVLDEPTFGQDFGTWSELVRLLGEQRAAGTAVLCVTHDAPFAATLADRVLTMAEGRLR